MTADRACPCLHTTPCHPDCTCVKPWMSRGCRRCCSYGSADQRRAAAERLAILIDAPLAARAQPEAPRTTVPPVPLSYLSSRDSPFISVLPCRHGIAPGECAECDGGSSGEMVSPPVGPIRCCECNGTADEPKGLCGGALHPPAPPCPECRNRPGHLDINGGEVPCQMCGRTYAPPAPPAGRFWRVGGKTFPWGKEYQVYECNSDGQIDPSRSIGGEHSTLAEAEIRGAASGLKRYEGGGK